MSLRQRIVTATPLICLIAFLTIGYSTNVWHPTWAVFGLVPIMPILLYTKWYRNLFAVVAAVTYIALSCVTGMWHPLWIILLTIPVYYILIGPEFLREGKRVEFRERRTFFR